MHRAERARPLLGYDRLIEEIEKRNEQLFRYALTKRGRRNLSADRREQLLFRNASSLYANNGYSRLAMAAAAEKKFRNFAKRSKLSRFHLVTFALREYSAPLDLASRVDLGAFAYWISQQLDGLDYFGLIEAGYYSNLPLVARKPGLISWHVHILVWGASEAELTALVDDVNRSHSSAVPGMDPAHRRSLGLGGAISRLAYISKATNSDSRVIQPKDGSPLKQKSRPIRPGQAVAVCRAMGNRNLFDLTVRGGDGIQLADRIFARAERIIERNEKRHLRKINRALGH